MDRHFAMPIAIAAALHAGLLFGNFISPHTGAHTEGKTKEPNPPMIKITDFPEPPPAEEKAAEETSSCGGVPRPDLPEPPIEHPENPFTVERQPLVATRPDLPPVITIGPPSGQGGRADGVPGWGNGPITPDQLDSTPRTRFQVAPQYPYEQRGRGIPGEVLVEFTVDESGAVLSPRVVHSSDRAFDEPTLRAIAKWRFEPGRRYGRVVSFRMAVPIVFKLDND